MGTVSSTQKVRCDDKEFPGMGNQVNNVPVREAPPEMTRPLSFEEKLYDKFRKQPLVPIGMAATAYFLVSGINSFQNRDPRRAQKMMRARVGAQFATLLAFVSYVGIDNVNFEIAPAYYRAKEAEAEYEKQMQNPNGNGTNSN